MVQTQKIFIYWDESFTEILNDIMSLIRPIKYPKVIYCEDCKEYIWKKYEPERWSTHCYRLDHPIFRVRGVTGRWLQ